MSLNTLYQLLWWCYTSSNGCFLWSLALTDQLSRVSALMWWSIGFMFLCEPLCLFLNSSLIQISVKPWQSKTHLSDDRRIIRAHIKTFFHVRIIWVDIFQNEKENGWSCYSYFLVVVSCELQITFLALCSPQMINLLPNLLNTLK